MRSSWWPRRGLRFRREWRLHRVRRTFNVSTGDFGTAPLEYRESSGVEDDGAAVAAVFVVGEAFGEVVAVLVAEELVENVDG